MKSIDENIEKVAGILKECKSILFITGAGVSADSGLPTYRGTGGLYNGKETVDGIPIETAFAGETLRIHPEITWKYLFQIEKGCRNAKFNKAHEFIAWAEQQFERVWVLTQNIDGFHHAAGSKNVIEIHGNIHRIFCEACGWRRQIKDFTQIAIPPYCPKCNSIARPNVVFFGEMLPQEVLDTLGRELKKGFDVYFLIGTTSVFPYIQQPILMARELGRPTVEINPSETEISHIVDIRIPLRAAEAAELIRKKYLDILHPNQKSTFGVS
ncbi:MAG: NAD-dependent protein deacylase [Omnitrophica WOR_2 bacterium RBG_13_44_8b]|nr:MAG: NAD-dependent protein deacylase [Omnitrophica WOR_2 bacterium RBG_13_44_8b]